MIQPDDFQEIKHEKSHLAIFRRNIEFHAR